MFVCPSVILTHGTTRVPMERFFENEHFFISRKSVENFLTEGMQMCFSTHNKTTSLFRQEHNKSVGYWYLTKANILHSFFRPS